MINVPAFDLLRKHKEVSRETEDLVRKQVRNKITADELFTAFENGISGKYGKLYSADPQTLIGWVDRYCKEKMNDKNYLASPLADVTMNENDNWDWNKEVNKCYHAFVSGVSHEYFHHAIYDTMLLDGKIEMDEYKKYYKLPVDADPKNTVLWDDHIRKIRIAKRKVIRDKFDKYKSYGYHDIYILRETH